MRVIGFGYVIWPRVQLKELHRTMQGFVASHAEEGLHHKNVLKFL
jgi:hypothetical protein